ncbi:hypothetical protein D3Y59_08880 [Hymenobacter oligotrophus]|uniref:Uncharacterized protein n=1 Tax=Hymenobacter oligotrophus TaxID=2319843 RepID=A0A3B7QZ59_9BACT|nr:hypothetical protein D3Y59_08880 [Hymenobacter oligotrophus]
MKALFYCGAPKLRKRGLLRNYKLHHCFFVTGVRIGPFQALTNAYDEARRFAYYQVTRCGRANRNACVLRYSSGTLLYVPGQWVLFL